MGSVKLSFAGAVKPLSFAEDLDRALNLLNSHGRASVRAIALEIGMDADYARSIRDEIVDVLQLATDDGNGILTARARDPGKARRQDEIAPPRPRPIVLPSGGW